MKNMKRDMRCFYCGQDVGQDGVLSVLLAKTADGRIESVDIRKCRCCAKEDK